jgi:hypothetical protein
LPFVLLGVYFLLPQREAPARAAAWPGYLLPAMCAVWLVLIVVPAWRQVNLRSPGPSWTSALDVARQKCTAGPPGAVVEVQLSPGYWYADLDCGVVAG